jgi:LPPG:FO 2-phospho-L-lactate transferase
MLNATREAGPVIALSGGVGGAKLALGLSRVLEPGALTVIANTGDDFEHLGLAISPDLDTLMYTLAGLDDPERGWGRKGETWAFMQALRSLGGPTWFQLGDADLATHVERSRRRSAGEELAAITDDFRRRLGVSARIIPMTDACVRTRVHTRDGWLDFQDYFVRLRCEPIISAIEFVGARDATADRAAIAALRDPATRAVVICPSNPLISIEPILAVPGMRDALVASSAPVIAVSPIVGGNAIKGPTAKMLRELGDVPDALTAARRYRGLLSGYVVDTVDAAYAAGVDMSIRVASTVMVSLEDREQLARVVLDFADQLAERGGASSIPAAATR